MLTHAQKTDRVEMLENVVVRSVFRVNFSMPLNQRVLGSSPRGGTSEVLKRQGVLANGQNPFFIDRHTIATQFPGYSFGRNRSDACFRMPDPSNAFAASR